MSKPVLLMIGPDPTRSLGGMATVVGNMLQSDILNNEYEIEMYPSFIDGPNCKRAAFSIKQETAFRLKRHQFDVCHIHVCSATSTWRKMRYIKSLGKAANRVVLHVHGGKYDVFWDSCSDHQRKQIRNLYASVAKVVVLSKEWYDFFIERGICDPGKLVVLHNAVNVPEESVEIRLHRDILFLGRLGAGKSPDVLLRAAKIVLSSHPEVRFRFGGDGDIAIYEEMASNLGISANCEFLGWTVGADKEGAIRKSRIYCLPSKHEGMPMSVLEAMSYGLATIATPVGGVPQVVEDGVNGYLMPIDDSDYLAERINALLDDSDLAERIGREGRKTIQDSFSMDAFSRKLIDIYKEIEAR